MKKQIFYIMLIAIAAFGTSCNKTYTCTCKYNTSGVTSHQSTIKSYSEHTARPQCDQYGSAEITCTLYKL